MNSRKLVRVSRAAILAAAALGLAAAGGAGCASPSTSGGTAGTTGTAGTGTTGSAGSAAGGTTGAAGTMGTGGGNCAPLTSTVGISNVTGPAVGAGILANSAVKKTLQVRYLSNDPMFTVTGAWLVDMTSRRSLPDDAFAYTFVALTYHGSVPYCYGQIDALTYRDAAGNSINANLSLSTTAEFAAFEAGTAMECAGLKQAVNNCVGPGESVFAVDHIGFSGGTLAATPIAGVDFTSISGYTTVADSQPDIDVVVTGYTVDTIDANSPQTLHATLKNTSNVSVMLLSLVNYFLLDEQGQPVYYGTFGGAQTYVALTAGQSITISDTTVGFDGSSTRIRFQPHFNRQ